ncbi:FUSC family protein [Methylobacterium nonmethylotrophicum]|uniref:FUSC family protein n=2 Tax=Methylobacterium nonmethylotrophicum TaxID=1141884 RepID=A0A4Z0NSZ0_9HYPH|nr:FUSC family protein [Methylobacterium nonmethylotrophicum]
MSEIKSAWGPVGPRLGALAWLWPREAMEAMRISLTVIAAIGLAMWFELTLPHWAAVTVISVNLATRAASLQKSLWYALGTIVGVMVALVLVANFAQATLAFDVALALWLGLLTAASSIESGQRSYGFALMGYTVPLVALGSVQDPRIVFDTGIDRCSTILLGLACAYASSVFVAPGVPAVRRALADRMQAVADGCARWVEATRSGGSPGQMPARAVLMLDDAVRDAFAEQPSLWWGGHAFRDAAPRLRWMLAAELLRARLGDRTGSHTSVLIGDGESRADRQIGRVRIAIRLLRSGGRIGRRPASLPLHLLLWNDYDWDGRHAVKNGVRTAVTVSLLNAFWYVTGWTDGSSAVIWGAVLAALFASHPDPAADARNFLVGTLMAAVVGIVVRYTLLTQTGEFMLLAAILLPLGILAALGWSDMRAPAGGGFAFFVLAVVEPTNVMTYDLAASLNQALAELLGIGATVIAFTTLVPPTGEATLRLRARRRLVAGVRRTALRNPLFLPPPDRWLARTFGRLALVQGDPDAAHGSETLLLVGLLMMMLRRENARLGREVGRIVAPAITPGASRGRAAGMRLREIAGRPGLTVLAAERVGAIAALVADLDAPETA